MAESGNALSTLLGLLFPPAVMLGIVPLFYGGRKVVWCMRRWGWVSSMTLTRRARE